MLVVQFTIDGKMCCTFTAQIVPIVLKTHDPQLTTGSEMVGKGRPFFRTPASWGHFRHWSTHTHSMPLDRTRGVRSYNACIIVKTSMITRGRTARVRLHTALQRSSAVPCFHRTRLLFNFLLSSDRALLFVLFVCVCVAGMGKGRIGKVQNHTGHKGKPPPGVGDESSCPFRRFNSISIVLTTNLHTDLLLFFG